MPRSLRLVPVVVLACFFVSGMAGLVYEVVWARYLALFLGHTSYAIVAVLVAFMGGLAIGNAWLGQWADRVMRPLALYAWLEIGIAAYALVFPAYYTWCHRGFLATAQHFEPGSNALLGLKFGFGLLTVLLPTVLMGGTLPALVRFATNSLAELRGQVATLYAVNSAGAALGCWVADFVYLPRWGLALTLWEAAGLNMLAGLVALLLSTRVQPTTTETASPTEEPISPRDLKLALIGISVSGFVAMLYEVAWTRLLALTLGSSTHALSLMLMTFIAGLAVGAWLVSRWQRLRRTMDAFGWTEVALAATLLGSMFLYDYLPYWFTRLAELLARREAAYPLYETLQVMVCLCVMLPPTICLGMTLPLVSRIATAELAHTGRAVGRVFAVNTVGTVLGAAVTGLWLMPALGLARTFAVGVAANALVGVAILQRDRWARRPEFIFAGSLLAAGLVWVAGHWFGRWPQTLTLGLWRDREPPTSLAQYRRSADDSHLMFYRDGANATVAVTSLSNERDAHQLRLVINGKIDATTTRDVATQLVLGHLPLLLRPNSERVLVVGLGSGMTCGAIATHAAVRQIDVVEISPEVAAAARLFQNHNEHVLDDPRLRLYIEDAKTYLQLGSQSYDVIVSEPSNPWMAGVAGVFSVEFFQSCRARLKPDGLMVQWIHGYESDDEMFDTILATFTSVFPYTSVWETMPNDLILVGAANAWNVDLSALESQMKADRVRQSLRRIGVTAPTVLLALEALPPEVTRFVPLPGTPLHSDFHPVLEYTAQRAFFVRSRASRWRTWDQRDSPRPTSLWARYRKDHSLTAEDFEAFREVYSESLLLAPETFRSVLYRWRHDLPHDSRPVQLIAGLPDSVLPVEAPVEWMRDVLSWESDPNPGTLRLFSLQLFRRYRNQRSAFFLPPQDELLTVLQRLAEIDPGNRPAYFMVMAELAWDRGDDSACLRWGEQALVGGSWVNLNPKLDPQLVAGVLDRMADAYLRTGQPQRAMGMFLLAAKTGLSSAALELSYRKLASSVSAPVGHFEESHSTARVGTSFTNESSVTSPAGVP